MSDEQKQAEIKAKGEAELKRIEEGILAPFTGEALSKDTSRGFELTSIKAQYIVERLNQTFGVTGWAASYQIILEDPDRGVIVKCTLKGNIFGNGQVIREAFGGCNPKKQIGDMIKSAMTDSLGKAASHMGIGNEVFKGKVKVGAKSKAKGKSKISSGDVF